MVLNMPRDSNSCKDRGTAGYICETCDLLAVCVKISSGWVNVPVETCDTENGFYCNSNMKSCSNVTGPCHPLGSEGNFPCTSEGIFPDPYNCQKYHMCYFVGLTLVAASVECGGNKVFNAATKDCSLPLNDPVCDKQQFECSSAGDARPWPNNPNIFYICQVATNQNIRVLHPTLYQCGTGEIFDGYICKPEGRVTSMTTTVSYTPKTSSFLPEITGTRTMPIITSDESTNGFSSSTAATTNLPEKCLRLGLYADPKDCYSYYYCSGYNGSLKHAKCSPGSYYNTAISSCTIGSC